MYFKEEFLVGVFVFTGCSKKENSVIQNDSKSLNGEKKVSVEKIIEITDYPASNIVNCMGLYNNLIYIMTVDYQKRKFVLKFFNKKGREVKKLTFDAGKGPGEMIHTGGVEIYNNKIYILDLQLKRLSYFTIKGDLIDTINMRNTGLILNFEIKEDIMYFFSKNKYGLGKYNIKTNEIIKGIKRTKFPENNDIYQGGVLESDGENIYFGKLSLPYRISYLNEALDIKKKIVTETKGYEKVIWRKKEDNSFTFGDYMINSMAVNGKYLYTPFLTKRKVLKNGKNQLKEVDGFINVYNKNTGKYIYKIINKNLKDLNGIYSIIGVNNEYIVLYIFALKDSDLVDNYFKSDNKKYYRAIVFLNNPLK